MMLQYTLTTKLTGDLSMTDIDLGVTSYQKDTCISFRKTKEQYGELSNMCSGFPILVGTHRFKTSEHLYQAFRFNNHSDIQKLIQGDGSPMGAKMKSKKYRDDTRDDWDEVRVDIMDWCLRMKLRWNWKKFGDILLDTDNIDIVEDSHKDQFWGCMHNFTNTFHGVNVLGKLLMNLRDELRNGEIDRDNLNLPVIKDMKLFGETEEDMLDVLAQARLRQKSK